MAIEEAHQKIKACVKTDGRFVELKQNPGALGTCR